MVEDLRKDGETVFEGVRFDIVRVELPGRDGSSHPRDAVIHPGAVAILPMLDRDTVVLIRNTRFAVGETLWEVPAGTLEPDEPIEDCAARELIEETGYEATHLTRLTTFYTSPGFCNERMHAFLAEGLTHVGQQLEASERIEVETVKWPRVIDMIHDGQIKDGKTLATLLFYQSMRGRS